MTVGVMPGFTGSLLHLCPTLRRLGSHTPSQASPARCPPPGMWPLGAGRCGALAPGDPGRVGVLDWGPGWATWAAPRNGRVPEGEGHAPRRGLRAALGNRILEVRPSGPSPAPGLLTSGLPSPRGFLRSCPTPTHTAPSFPSPVPTQTLCLSTLSCPGTQQPATCFYPVNLPLSLFWPQIT